MPEDSGFIVLYRSILKWEWYDDANTMRLFVHLLLLANHSPNNWHGITIERGQAVTSIAHLSRDLKISHQSIRTSIERLKSTGEITIKTTNKYSLVTIANYGFYQNKENKSTRKTTRQLTLEQQTTNKQLTTNNNDNNENNENKGVQTHGSAENVRLTQVEIDRLNNDYSPDLVSEAIEYLSLYIVDKGDKSKAKTHNATLRRWVFDAVQEKKAKQPRKEPVVQKYRDII